MKVFDKNKKMGEIGKKQIKMHIVRVERGKRFEACVQESKVSVWRERIVRGNGRDKEERGREYEK